MITPFTGPGEWLTYCKLCCTALSENSNDLCTKTGEVRRNLNFYEIFSSFFRKGFNHTTFLLYFNEVTCKPQTRFMWRKLCDETQFQKTPMFCQILPLNVHCRVDLTTTHRTCTNSNTHTHTQSNTSF